MADNLGSIADSLHKKHEEISAINAQLKEVEGEKREIENKLLALMEQAGTDIVRGKRATVSTSITIRASIADFDVFTKFVARKKAYHLFERRVAAVAYREMKESLGGKEVPGLSEYPQTRLNVRSI